MAVLAWAPSSDPRGFVAHLTSGAVRYSLEEKGELLPEMIVAMRSAFEGTDLADVQVNLVGDLVGEPLKRYFKDGPEVLHRCSVHVEQALRTAGFKNIEKELTGLYEDDDCSGSDLAGMPRSRVTGRRFSFISLDLKMGRVIAPLPRALDVAKKDAGGHWRAIQAEYERDLQFSHRRGLYAPMTTAAGMAWDSSTLFSDLAAKPFTAIGTIAAVIWFCVQLVPHLIANWESRKHWLQGAQMSGL